MKIHDLMSQLFGHPYFSLAMAGFDILGAIYAFSVRVPGTGVSMLVLAAMQSAMYWFYVRKLYRLKQARQDVDLLLADAYQQIRETQRNINS